MKNQIIKKALLLCLFISSVSACTSREFTYEKNQSYALAPDHMPLIAETLEEHPYQSGFRLLREGRTAFVSRIYLAHLAQKTIDVQYYIWKDDRTGSQLANALLQAANRGVRVRMLVDDNGINGDKALTMLNAHPNIELQIFNPFVNRKHKVLNFATDFRRVNHRMHNKLFIVDNSVAIVGGRNIADNYFDVGQHANLRDLDVLSIGPVVPKISEVFDTFWNGNFSVLASELTDESIGNSDLRAFQNNLKQKIETEGYPYDIAQGLEEVNQAVREIFSNMAWGTAQVVYDDPYKLAESGKTSDIKNSIDNYLSNIDNSLLIESAYFVPTESGTETLTGLADRGVYVRILTNSLSSNDVAAAHAGYRKSRDDLLKAGIELHELRIDSKALQHPWSMTSGESQAGLHTKAMVFDDDAVFIGSYNLDPRSANLNTEAGLFVKSDELARRTKAYLDEGALPENSFLVKLDDDGDVVWIDEKDAELTTYTKEPNTSWWKRFTTSFIGMFPVETQL